MGLLAFEDDAADVIPYGHSDFGKKHFCTSAHALTADDFLSVLFYQNGIYQLLYLFRACMVTSSLLHVINQFISDHINGNHFFFCDAGKVVVKGTSIDDVFCCLGDISCLIHKYRRISSACAHSSLSRRKNSGYNARTAGSYQHVHVFMFENIIADYHGGVCYSSYDVGRSAHFNAGPVYHVDGQIRAVLCRRMRHKYDCISCC